MINPLVFSYQIGKQILGKLINQLDQFKKKNRKFSDSSFLDVSVFWFLFSSMTANGISLGCGQNKTFDDAVLDLGN